MEQAWYRSQYPWTQVLAPLELLFKAVVSRRIQQRRGAESGPPVIVVGNLTVGGAGKTPVVIALCQMLHSRGFSVGIVSRGYGGQAEYPLSVNSATPVSASGDEPKLLAEVTGCPVVVDPDRARACQYLSHNHPVDFIVSDDGLQHYAMPRDFEIVVVDGDRQFGNGHCLPVGPLREPLSRLELVDLVLINGARSDDKFGERVPGISSVVAECELGSDKVLHFRLQPVAWVNVASQARVGLTELPKGVAWKALAGIGNPERFFTTLKTLGVQASCHGFADHRAFTSEDLQPFVGAGLLMTSKDAIKLRERAQGEDNWWYLDVAAALPAGAVQRILHFTEIFAQSK